MNQLWLRKKKIRRGGNHKQRLLVAAGEVEGGAPLLNEENKVFYAKKLKKIFK
jgi:hypothetical protein